MSHDPIHDEKKPYTLREWEVDFKEAVAQYANTFDNANAFHKQPHTYDEWTRTFLSFIGPGF